MPELAAKHGYYHGGVTVPNCSGVSLSNFYQLRPMLDVARDMDKICPDACLIQSANPGFEAYAPNNRELAGHYRHPWREGNELMYTPQNIRPD